MPIFLLMLVWVALNVVLPVLIIAVICVYAEMFYIWARKKISKR
jgi:hypothetical protein